MSISKEAQARKDTPIWSGFVNYFPKAMAEVARLSWVGNEQHNPGTELHWDRAKSGDEKDACMRHLAEAGTIDTDGVRHSTKCAWRAMANLEKELEEAEAVGVFLKRSEERVNAPDRSFTSLEDVLDAIKDTPVLERKFDDLPVVGAEKPFKMAFDDACDGSHEPSARADCSNCHYLQNQIDRHECRVLTPPATVYPTAGKFHRYLRNFHSVEHYRRWEAIDDEKPGVE